jgi:hypothetical protein
MEDRKQIARIVRYDIAHARLSRRGGVFRTRLGKSTVDKLRIGHFSDCKLSIVESQTGLDLRRPCWQAPPSPSLPSPISAAIAGRSTSPRA